MGALVFRQKRLIATILNHVDDGIAAMDAKLSVIFMNPAAERMSGLSEKEARKNRIQYTLSLIDPVALCPLFPAALPSDNNPKLFKNAILKSHCGITIIVDGSITKIPAAGGEALGYVVVFRDISAMKKLTAVIDYQAHHDSLTGLSNREGLMLQLRELLEELKRDGGNHTLLEIDIDTFTSIIECGGSLAGDQVLKEIADMFRSSIQRRDLAARLGGDTFILILRDCGAKDAVQVAARLQKAVQGRQFSAGGKNVSLSVSISIVPLTGQTEDPKEVLLTADTACRDAKKAGGNRIVHVPDEAAATA